MTAIDDPQFKTDSPETYNWDLLDSPTLSSLAKGFASRIRSESLFKDRPYMGGLRFALVEIAKIARL